MKNKLTIALVFLSIWGFSTGFIYVLGLILDRNTFKNWGYIILLGFSCAFFGIYGSIIGDKIRKQFNKKS